MHSAQIYRALHSIPNRFTLCRTISQSARRIHINGAPLEGTLTTILNGIEDGSVRGKASQLAAAAAAENSPIIA
jgi:hypothetical protein